MKKIYRSMNPNKLQEEETKSSYLISSYEIKSHHNHHSQIVANNNFKNIFKIEKKKCIFYKETKIRIVADFYQNHACQRTRVSFLKALGHVFKSFKMIFIFSISFYDIFMKNVQLLNSFSKL